MAKGKGTRKLIPKRAALREMTANRKSNDPTRLKLEKPPGAKKVVIRGAGGEEEA